MRFRTDRDSARVGVLPTCKRGLHALNGNYKAVVEGPELRVTCETCWSVQHPDHSWR